MIDNTCKYTIAMLEDSNSPDVNQMMMGTKFTIDKVEDIAGLKLLLASSSTDNILLCGKKLFRIITYFKIFATCFPTLVTEKIKVKHIYVDTYDDAIGIYTLKGIKEIFEYEKLYTYPGGLDENELFVIDVPLIY